MQKMKSNEPPTGSVSVASNEALKYTYKNINSLLLGNADIRVYLTPVVIWENSKPGILKIKFAT
jgi:hypothetical protein